MKTVGKQLQEARLARNWTPELAARETKIKVDRLRDLEADDYSHFTSPTYARGFVRTYARALGLDEYRILRQLDNKLPDDDSANIVTDSGVAYLPETALPPRAAHRDFTALYVVLGLGAVVSILMIFFLIEAYRVGELPTYFGNTSETASTGSTNETNAAVTAASPSTNAASRALPVDSDTPPPIVDNATTNATSDATASSTNTPRALPVDPATLAADTNAAPTTNMPSNAPKALPVDPSELTNSAPATTPPPPQTASTSNHTTNASTEKAPPRALPVSASELAAASSAATVTTNMAVNVPSPPPDPAPDNTASAKNASPVVQPAPSSDAATTSAASTSSDSTKRLILTASQDSFVRVTNLDQPDAEKPLYASVLHSGQSVGFPGHKFSINVGVPSAVEIKLDGVNYGPHSDQEAPETFTVQSHLP